jgi:hypothetical protein
LRNVNLNILKFLDSINNFCLSLSNIGLGVSYQLSVISYQLSVIRCEFLVYCLLKKLPTPYTLHPTPHTLHREHLTYAMSINAYSRQKLEHLQLDHKEK